MPRPRHHRQPSQVLPPELISGEDPSQILDFERPVAGAFSGQPHQAAPEAAAAAAAAANAAASTVIQQSKIAASQEVSGAEQFPQLTKTPPSAA
ncbi:hypothetical protein SDJN03_16787, partial [Cucurbita argyrosperma subsp. sororia]